MRFQTLADWLVWQEGLHPKSIDLGLGRVGKVYRTLGISGKRPITLTIGGTNGKGSCVAMLDAILRAEGYRVGTYTSPHLLSYNERIKINGVPMDDDAICESFGRIDAARGDITLSFFEFGTLAALDIFSRADLDVQILEVGLGGRLDAVNLIDADAAMIASIDIDHQDWLGNSRAQIALEKAGIFRSGTPAIVGDPDPPSSLLDFAGAQGIRLLCQQRDFGFEKAAERWRWYGDGDSVGDLPFPALRGDHQFLNASAGIQVLRSIRQKLPVSDSSIRRGLESVRLTGRFQLIDSGPVPTLLDVAHNPQSVQVLASFLQQEFAGKRIHAVFAVMRDKDIEGVLRPIKDLISRWYLAPLSISRAAPEENLLKVFGDLSVAPVEHGFPGSASAFAAAFANAQNVDLVVIFGSFFLVSEYLAQQAYDLR